MFQGGDMPQAAFPFTAEATFPQVKGDLEQRFPGCCVSGSLSLTLAGARHLDRRAPYHRRLDQGQSRKPRRAYTMTTKPTIFAAWPHDVSRKAVIEREWRA